jgi:hypothetical protein
MANPATVATDPFENRVEKSFAGKMVRRLSVLRAPL